MRPCAPKSETLASSPLDAAEVLASRPSPKPNPARRGGGAKGGARSEAEFYAQLYLGWYFEALGNADRARVHITAAAADRHAAAGGYMHDVARTHLRLLPQRR